MRCFDIQQNIKVDSDRLITTTQSVFIKLLYTMTCYERPLEFNYFPVVFMFYKSRHNISTNQTGLAGFSILDSMYQIIEQFLNYFKPFNHSKNVKNMIAFKR